MDSKTLIRKETIEVSAPTPIPSKQKPDDITYALKLIIVVALYLTASYLASLGGLAMSAGVLAMGLTMAHAVELQHQALHYAGFRSRGANDIAGVLLGLPALVPFGLYQYFHLIHHHLLGTAEDQAFFAYTRATQSLLGGLKRLFVPHALRQLLAFTPKGANDTALVCIRRDLTLCILFLCSLIMLAASGNRIGVAWLLAYFFVYTPMHALIEWPEHEGCDSLTKDALHNTRTIRSSALLTWYTNGNNLHVEHHIYPGLQTERLRDVHDALKGQHAYYLSNYRDFYKSVFKAG